MVNMPSGVPSTATAFRYVQGPGFPTPSNAFAGLLACLEKEMDQVNGYKQCCYNYACNEWTTENTHNQEQGSPLTSKPVAPQKEVLINQVSEDGSTLYVWNTPGDPIGPPCPDVPVPAKVAAAESSPRVGVQLDGNYYQVDPSDTAPAGTVVADSRGTFTKVQRGIFQYYVKSSTPAETVAHRVSPRALPRVRI